LKFFIKIQKNKGVISMYKKVLLITSILIIGGCVEKTDFTKGLSEKDKMLRSSKKGGLYLYKKKILITDVTIKPKPRN
jgi:hypothetical protein